MPRHVSNGMPNIKSFGGRRLRAAFFLITDTEFVGGLFLIGARTKRKLAALSAPEDWAARPVRVLMPGGDTESDAASNAAATKVQAILRGSKARKSVAKPRKSVAVIIPVAGRAEEVRSSALARAACPLPADAPASPPSPPSPAACEPALRLRRQCR